MNPSGSMAYTFSMNSDKSTEGNKIVFLPKAIQDLGFIYNYYLENLLLKELHNLEEDFRLHFERIMKYPKAYPLLEQKDILMDGLRKSVLDDYLIFYLFNELRSIVLIVRVVHSKSKLEKFLQ